MGKPRSTKQPRPLRALPAGLPNGPKAVRDETLRLMQQQAVLLTVGEAGAEAKTIRLAGEHLPGAGTMNVRRQLGCFNNDSNLGYIPLLAAQPRVDFVETRF